MAIEPGQLLLHYRLIEQIGEGGMGVVWKAIDTALDREVAIKILPESFRADPDRLARFEREAKLLASVNDPRIAAIYGLHQVEETQFLAMELIQGESLDKRIQARGGLDQDEVRAIAMQVAAALETAHAQGVIHRDLKPANIQITLDGNAKVLDFGLAKAVQAGGSSDPAIGLSVGSQPTMTSAGTVAGLVLGTGGYMSPEQARGRAVDRRTDIWAFGCVLYEMLTGKALFAGETLSDSIARTLEREPDFEALPAGLPGSIRELLRRCLVKDPQKRLRDAGDAWLVLEEWTPGVAGTGTPATATATKRWWPLAAIGIGGLLVGAAVVLGLRPTPPELPMRKFQTPVEGLEWAFTGGVFPSPDGRHLAYVQNDRLMIRDLARLEARAFEAVGSDFNPPIFWSPDSRYIGYGLDEQLWKVSLDGGAPESICMVPETGGTLGAAWGKDGRIVFAVWRGGMYSVPATGGNPELLLPVDHETIVDFHTITLLPNGNVLYDVHPTARPDAPYLGGIHVLDGSTPRQLLPEGSFPAYAPSGHLVYAEGLDSENARIRAVPFDASSQKITGEPFLVADSGVFPFVTASGDLAFVREDGARAFQLAFVDAEGSVLEALGEPTPSLRHPSVSPDGTHVAVAYEANKQRDIWIVSTQGSASRRLTFTEEQELERSEYAPAFSPDGKDVLFARPEGNMGATIYAIAADGSGSERKLFPGMNLHFSPSGRHVVYHTHDAASDDDLWVAEIPEGGKIDDAEPRTLFEGNKRHRMGRLSPSGRILAYEVRDGEDTELFLSRFPGGEGRWQVSTGGGRDPRWSADGSKLYFLDDDLALHEVSVQTEPSIELSRPRLLFANNTNGIEFWLGYDVARDGRLLVVRVVSDDRKRYIVFVQNWLGEFAGD